MIRKVTAFAFALALLTACQRETENKIAEFSGHIFVFNYRLSKANYVVTLRPLEQPLRPGSATAYFDNPRGGDYLVARQTLYPNMTKIVLESPDLQCVKEGKTYHIRVDIAGSDDKVRQTLEADLVATIDQSVLPAQSLVVGPAYDLNPQVFKPNDAIDLSPVQGCPA
ncbi:hypothetical protein MUU53_09435 [Rhizobium lemnae]|uniref:DUF1254 domain-containing protein n=1 Tax=Rhizobium lemnae TaxID=1214924 RepID=A0ABV8EB54_9HYPH|nr:hypothetical protein [Rhizobium lemnae]MCJ8508131.1 hypothetical protein [Rhizobium lemnae]